MSPFRKCQHPSCGALVREGTGSRCPRHAAAAAAQRRVYDRARGTDPFRMFYSSPAWRSFRQAVLTARPFCVDCGGPAQDVDHVVTIREAPERALDLGNVEPRCHPHHSARTSKFHSWHRR